MLDEDDRYAGIVLLPEAHADEDDDHKVRDIVHYADTVLLPQMTIKEAVAMFENAESDALVVVDSAQERHVIGLLTEQYALRRYSDDSIGGAGSCRGSRRERIAMMPLEIKLDPGGWRCAADQHIAFGWQIQRFRRVGDFAFDQPAFAVVANA